MCVALIFFLVMRIFPSELMVACAIYRLSWIFSVKPSTTITLFAAAEAWILAICGESSFNELRIYAVVICGSSGRSLVGFVLSVQISFKLAMVGMAVVAHHIQAGYPGTQHSGNAMSCAPFDAASAIREQVLSTVASRSSHTGSAWVTATRTCFAVDMFN